MQIWLKTNQEAHNFISPDYWSSHYDMVKEMLLRQKYTYMKKMKKMRHSRGEA